MITSAARIYVQASVPCLPLLRIPPPFCRLRSKSSFILLRGFKPPSCFLMSLSWIRGVVTRTTFIHPAFQRTTLSKLDNAESSPLFIDPDRQSRYQISVARKLKHSSCLRTSESCGIGNSILIATNKKKINLSIFKIYFISSDKFEDVLHEYYFNVKKESLSINRKLKIFNPFKYKKLLARFHFNFYCRKVLLVLQCKRVSGGRINSAKAQRKR